MLQSEFFERTEVTLDSEQYAKVEAIYDEVKMDKDEFCKEWKKFRNSKLMGEIEDAMLRVTRESRQKDYEMTRMEGVIEEKNRFHIEEMEKAAKAQGEHQMELAKRIICAGSDESRLYDIIEEEFGIAFIIRTKREALIPFTEQEIDYMVSRL